MTAARFALYGIGTVAALWGVAGIATGYPFGGSVMVGIGAVVALGGRFATS